ncbi:MAG: hypothetical protein ABI478_08740 [Propionivibrio sp.]
MDVMAWAAAAIFVITILAVIANVVDSKVAALIGAPASGGASANASVDPIAASFLR